MFGTIARQQLKVPIKLICTILFHISISYSHSGAVGPVIPALFIKISILPFDGGTYKQAPFEDCSKETYEHLLANLKEVDLTKVTETEDNTELTAELACAGGVCEIF